MLHLFENPINMTAHEDLGYDSVWPAEHHFSEYGVMAPPQGQDAVRSYEEYAKSRDLAASVEFDDLVDGPVMVCGDMDYCTEKLTRLAREFGFNELLCRTRLGGLENRKVLDAMELMSGRIMPAVRKAMPEAA